MYSLKIIPRESEETTNDIVGDLKETLEDAPLILRLLSTDHLSRGGVPCCRYGM